MKSKEMDNGDIGRVILEHPSYLSSTSFFISLLLSFSYSLCILISLSQSPSLTPYHHYQFSCDKAMSWVYGPC